jgi:hypothetical protein
MKSVRIIILCVVLAFLKIAVYPRDNSLRKDTMNVYCHDPLPVFDGFGNDKCWQCISWHPIDQVWMPWGEKMDSADFSGRYKIIWSDSKDLFYLLIEIVDDTISDAYLPGKTASIYNFDMFEVFIDEDCSGGYHVFEGKANNENGLGVNAENAFAYHIITEIPDSGTSTVFRAEDLGGFDWEHVLTKIYTNHFPDFISRREGNKITWEFSLIVYNDSFSEDNPEISKSCLIPGKVMGFSVAYNDDDQPQINPTLTIRDNFIGSVPVKKEAYNDHWKNADDFGIIKLMPDSCPVKD